MKQQDDPIERLMKKGVRFLLNDAEVALMLGYTPSAMRQRRYKHPDTLPPSFLMGKCHRYDPEEVAAWIKEKRHS